MTPAPMTDAEVMPMTSTATDTVSQLLDSGHLRLGGTHLVSDGRREGPARSVLVTTATRTLLTRWAARTPATRRGGER